MLMLGNELIRVKCMGGDEEPLLHSVEREREKHTYIYNYIVNIDN